MRISELKLPVALGVALWWKNYTKGDKFTLVVSEIGSICIINWLDNKALEAEEAIEERKERKQLERELKKAELENSKLSSIYRNVYMKKL